MLVRKGLLRTYSSVFLYLYKMMDIAIVVLSGILAFYLVTQETSYDSLHKSLLILSAFIFSTIASKFRLYAPWRGRHFRDELAVVALSGVMLTVSIFIVSMVIDYRFLVSSSISWVAVWGLFTIMGQAGARFFLRMSLKAARFYGFNQRKLILVGSNSSGKSVIDEIESHPEYGLQIVGYVDDRSTPRGKESLGIEYLGKTERLPEIIHEKDIDQVWIAYPGKGEERARQIIDLLRHETISTRLILDMNMLKDSDKTLTDLAGIPLLDVDVSPMDGTVSRVVKTIEDKVLSLLILLLISPLMLLIAMGVKLSSPGPVFYRQTRISWNNEPFGMLKFRSMPTDVETQSGAQWAKPGDNRATPFGAFLRKTSLDELPQFINVLKGDMSIVGPRPERPEFVEQFKDEIPNYMKKHMVKAGITGWAQVNGLRGDTDLKDRIEHDMYYIRHWSPFFDLEIALRTIVSGFVNKNAY
ncbi:MAG: undecaprenyl-phosphate glucose phosphotransferase [Gammaproteobacteria bacterium]